MSDVATGGGTMEQGRTPPLAARGNMARWMTPSRQRKRQHQRRGKGTRGEEEDEGATRDGTETGGTGGAWSNERDGSTRHRVSEMGRRGGDSD